MTNLTTIRQQFDRHADLYDRNPLWQEWQELLAPDGRLIVTAPNGSSPLVSP